MNPVLRFFLGPIIVSVVVLGAVFVLSGPHAFLLAVLLTVLEVTLSFDNAVVNAKVLEKMDAKWQARFLTWGIAVAVVGTRFVLPILIVAAAVALSPVAVATLAFFSPEEYGALLADSRETISAFGGTFLLMVSLKYFFDTAKEVHWIHFIERHISRWGRIEALEIGLSLIALLVVAAAVPAHAASVLAAGTIGIVTFVAMQGVASAFTLEASAGAAKAGLALFIYLNVLDAAFSLDGVVGAFAITSQLPAIVVGLGIGAYLVRSLTIYLVRQKTLESLIYLEHGAHWAIFGLAASMFVSIFHEVPEVITGLIGLVFVGAAYWSSIRARSASPAKASAL